MVFTAALLMRMSACPYFAATLAYNPLIESLLPISVGAIRVSAAGLILATSAATDSRRVVSRAARTMALGPALANSGTKPLRWSASWAWRPVKLETYSGADTATCTGDNYHLASQ